MSAAITIGTMIGRRLLQRRVAGVLVLLASAPALVLAITAEGAQPEGFHRWMLFLYYALGLPILALVTATAALGDERHSHTLPYLTTKPVPRWSIAAAGWGAAVAVSTMIGAIGVGSAWAVTLVRTGDSSVAWPALVGTIITVVGYAAVFVPLGLLAKQATLIGLGFVLIWEGVIASAGRTLAVASLWRTGLSGHVALAGEVPTDLVESLGNLTPGAGGALAKAGALAVASLALTTWLLRKRDLVKE